MLLGETLDGREFVTLSGGPRHGEVLPLNPHQLSAGRIASFLSRPATWAQVTYHYVIERRKRRGRVEWWMIEEDEALKLDTLRRIRELPLYKMLFGG